MGISILFGSMCALRFFALRKKKKKRKEKEKEKRTGQRISRETYICPLLTYAAAKDGKGFGFIFDSALVGWQKEGKKRKIKKGHINSIIVSVVVSLKPSTNRNTSFSLNSRRFFFVSIEIMIESYSQFEKKKKIRCKRQQAMMHQK